jgi:hypothetical protein
MDFPCVVNFICQVDWVLGAQTFLMWLWECALPWILMSLKGPHVKGLVHFLCHYWGVVETLSCLWHLRCSLEGNCGILISSACILYSGCEVNNFATCCQHNVLTPHNPKIKRANKSWSETFKTVSQCKPSLWICWTPQVFVIGKEGWLTQGVSGWD